MTFRFTGTLVGSIVGAVVTAVALASFTWLPDEAWPLLVTNVSAWLGFWAMQDWYQGFPTRVGLALTNGLLILSAAVQWSIVGLIYDLGHHFWASQGNSTASNTRARR